MHTLFFFQTQDPGASSRINPIQADVNLTQPVNVIGGDNTDAGHV
jgi:peptidyl-prolyl isomerase G (cyclophilin G)